MKKFWNTVGDVAVTVGGIVGVGFLSGKEAQLYWSSGSSIVIFAALFAVTTLSVRELCRVSGAATVSKMGEALFGRRGGVWQYAIVFCSFVCIVTVLAGVDQCLSVLFVPLSLPVYAFVAAFVAALLARSDLRVLKTANVISLLIVAAFVVALYATQQKGTKADISPSAPIVYALFSVTMTLGASAKLGKNCTAKANLLVSAVSALVAGALMFALLPLCDFRASLPTLGNVSELRTFCAVTLLLCSATGLAANVLPVTEMVKEVVPDETLCIVLIFGVALAFSMFGFDFAMRIGYVAVACVGALTVIAAIKKRHFIAKQIKNGLK